MTNSTYDGLTASEYLKREFSAGGKPHDCECNYPKTKMRNGIGHPSECPTWRRLATPYYECKGLRYLGINDEGHILVEKLPPADQGREDIAYESVIKRINEQTVTVDDFNKLIENTDKSTREQVYRSVRVDDNTGTDFSMAGRVVPKRTGENNPPKQGRGKRYASGTPAKERQNEQQRKRMRNKEQSARLSEAIKVVIGDVAIPSDNSIDIIKDIRASASSLLCCEDTRSKISAITGRIIDTDRLYRIVVAADNRLLSLGERPEEVRPVRLVVEQKGQGTQKKATPGQKKSGGHSDDEETRSYEITGKVDNLDSLEQLFRWMQTCGSVGHSATAKVSVDGDGDGKLSFDGLTADYPEEVKHNSDVELHIGIV